MNWMPDRNRLQPIHKQIEQHVKDKIKRGEWPLGHRLPSQRELAKTWNVNRSTVVTAFDELISQGLLQSHYGAGTTVCNNSWGLIAATSSRLKTFVQSGQYKPNLPIIQKINEAEYDKSMIRIGTGELAPELLPNELLASILKRVPPNLLSLGYQEPKGDLFLREQLVEHLSRLGIHTDPSCILIVSGALQAMQLISLGLLERGSTILLEKPSYLFSINVFQSLGMRFVGLPMDNEGLQVESISKKYNGSILYTIPTFHNPTGITMSLSRRNRVMDMIQKENLPMIEDDVYRELWLDEQPPRPLKSLDSFGNVLYVGSASKILSPGLRIGWVVGSESVIDRLADIKMQSDYGSSSLSQWIVAEAFRTGAFYDHAEWVRVKLKERRDKCLKWLERYFSGIGEWDVPSGGFYIWLKLIHPVSHRLFHLALKNHVLLNPGALYDRSASQYLRLSYAYASSEEMEQALRILREIVIKEMVN